MQNARERIDLERLLLDPSIGFVVMVDPHTENDVASLGLHHDYTVRLVDAQTAHLRVLCPGELLEVQAATRRVLLEAFGELAHLLLELLRQARIGFEEALRNSES